MLQLYFSSGYISWLQWTSIWGSFPHCPCKLFRYASDAYIFMQVGEVNLKNLQKLINLENKYPWTNQWDSYVTFQTKHSSNFSQIISIVMIISLQHWQQNKITFKTSKLVFTNYSLHTLFEYFIPISLSGRKLLHQSLRKTIIAGPFQKSIILDNFKSIIDIFFKYFFFILIISNFMLC